MQANGATMDFDRNEVRYRVAERLVVIPFRTDAGSRGARIAAVWLTKKAALGASAVTPVGYRLRPRTASVNGRAWVPAINAKGDEVRLRPRRTRCEAWKTHRAQALPGLLRRAVCYPARRLAEEAQRQAGREHVGVESNVVHDKEDDATHESTRVVDTTSGPAEGRWRPRATSRVLPGGSTGDDTVMGNATAAVMNQTTANDPPQPGVNEGGAGDDTEGSLRGVPRRTEAVKCIVELKTSQRSIF
ncbi:hypothetical protein GQ600_19120 [Phytophthora cactorum]|nr:hypothetical protein GQ600_19120 [Phytophthora cactorum]